VNKIVFVTASPETVSSFLLAYINGLSAKYDIHVATNMGDHDTIRGLSPEIKVHHVAIARNPQVWADLCALKALYSLFRQQRFDVVHSFTPKAGLLSQISSFVARSQFRFHTFTGQVWVTKTGLGRTLLKYLDKVTASLATFCLVDSPSQQSFLIQENLLSQHNSTVLAQGSISGVDVNKFSYSQSHRQQLRTLHNIDDNDFVFLFVGRLKVDKGIPELVAAFKQLKTQRSVKLFLIGSDEDNLQSLFTGCENIDYIGFKTNVAEYYAFADMLCLPSHREGFGNVIIEAAACNLPAIAANIYGLSDAVQDGYSGLLHTVKDIASIQHCMEKVLDDDVKIQEMRINARTRVENTFAEPLLVSEFISFYDNMLK
jgi:glycosyltransferase involved in cell wall biosynthesis